MKAFVAAVLLCFLALTAYAFPVGLSFEPDTPHYFEYFDPEQKPWQPGQALNIEEVFKNYQYYEIRFLKKGTEIQVQHYIRNQRESTERYRFMPDGTLKKISL